MEPLAHSHPLHQMFAGLTEQTFFAELGWTDTQVVDYLAELLTRFVHRDAIYAIHGANGRRLEELAAMLVEAENPQRKGEARREIFKQVGDVALFWTGVFPEALQSRSFRQSADALLSFHEQGKRGYFIASTYHDTPTQAEQAPVLRRLAEEFELCVEGLRIVRRQLSRAQG